MTDVNLSEIIITTVASAMCSYKKFIETGEKVVLTPEQNKQIYETDKELREISEAITLSILSILEMFTPRTIN